MKKMWIITFIFCAFIYPAAAEATDSAEKNSHWGFSGALEIGGLWLAGQGFSSIEDAGYGSIGTESAVPVISAGMNYRMSELFDLALSLSYSGGGSFLWSELFGDTYSSFSLYADSLSVQLEIQPLFPFLQGFHPFIGGGYSIANGLIDDIGEGFVGGQGPFIVGGLYIFNSFGMDPNPILYMDETSAVGIRISAYYRFPYAYSFSLNWDELSAAYSGPADFETLRSFFENNTFPTQSFAVSIGLSLEYTPF
ncbi:MAG: hypothetical protein JEZ04_14445 [Spirochaetales bacterium]|nr:hypothetical protein [Spirochaetales bacterium]